MTRFSVVTRWSAAAVLAAGVAGAATTFAAQKASPSLGQVRIVKAVKANGQPLPAGTYTLRLTGDQGRPVVGQTPDESQWVEFVQGTDVKGRELATVLTTAEAKKVVKGGKLPAAGAPSAELMRGSDYIRVWITRGSSYYIVHLAVAP